MIIQYNAVNPKTGKRQGFLKEVSKEVYHVVYVPALKKGTISNLEIIG